jgi:hypothetical protein
VSTTAEIKLLSTLSAQHTPGKTVDFSKMVLIWNHKFALQVLGDTIVAPHDAIHSKTVQQLRKYHKSLDSKSRARLSGYMGSAVLALNDPATRTGVAAVQRDGQLFFAASQAVQPAAATAHQLPQPAPAPAEAGCRALPRGPRWLPEWFRSRSRSRSRRMPASPVPGLMGWL